MDMGNTYKISSINKEQLNKLMTPIIFCVKEDKLSPYISGYSTISLNALLAQKLISYDPDKRGLFVTEEFNRIIDSLNEPILLREFEILFDPEFQLDVLKLFIQANRKKRIDILWPGKYKSQNLVFAESGYKDYKAYNISSYALSCII